MSTSIDLYFKELRDPRLVVKGIDLLISRLFVRVRMRTKTAWTDPHPAIVDTGAPTSIVPMRLWNPCEVDILGDHTIRGIVAAEECALPVLVGCMSFVFADRRHESPMLTAKTYLALTDEVPLLIGFSGLLDRCVLHVDAPAKTASLIVS